MTDPRKLAEKVLSTVLASQYEDVDELARELLKALDERDRYAAELRAATDMLVEAEKIVPGLMQTAGRFALGNVAGTRAERDRLREVLHQVANSRLQSIPGVNPDGSVSSSTMAECIARDALAALEEK
jgi:hypothetical protein